MTDEALLRDWYVSLEVDASFGEALLGLSDQSRLRFCHRVGQRWARAEDAAGHEAPATHAAHLLARLAQFRLNAKHLDLQFADGTGWEARFGGRKTDG
jgi:hypothetical protein